MGFALSTMQLTSTAFDLGGPIPPKFTGEAVGVSPALAWTDVPEGPESVALICPDPGAPRVQPGTYGCVHWVLSGLPGSADGLPEGVGDYTQGVNDFGNAGYGGPMPPPGHGTHHYFFWLLALDSEMDLPPGLTLWELLGKIEPNVVGMNRLVGTYSRS